MEAGTGLEGSWSSPPLLQSSQETGLEMPMNSRGIRGQKRMAEVFSQGS